MHGFGFASTGGGLSAVADFGASAAAGTATASYNDLPVAQYAFPQQQASSPHLAHIAGGSYSPIASGDSAALPSLASDSAAYGHVGSSAAAADGGDGGRGALRSRGAAGGRSPAAGTALMNALPPGWAQLVDESGFPYYYHEASGHSQWERPQGSATAVMQAQEQRSASRGGARNRRRIASRGESRARQGYGVADSTSTIASDPRNYEHAYGGSYDDYAHDGWGGSGTTNEPSHVASDTADRSGGGGGADNGYADFGASGDAYARYLAHLDREQNSVPAGETSTATSTARAARADKAPKHLPLHGTRKLRAKTWGKASFRRSKGAVAGLGGRRRPGEGRYALQVGSGKAAGMRSTASFHPAALPSYSAGVDYGRDGAAFGGYGAATGGATDGLGSGYDDGTRPQSPGVGRAQTMPAADLRWRRGEGAGGAAGSSAAAAEGYGYADAHYGYTPHAADGVQTREGAAGEYPLTDGSYWASGTATGDGYDYDYHGSARNTAWPASEAQAAGAHTEADADAAAQWYYGDASPSGQGYDYYHDASDDHAAPGTAVGAYGPQHSPPAAVATPTPSTGTLYSNLHAGRAAGGGGSLMDVMAAAPASDTAPFMASAAAVATGTQPLRMSPVKTGKQPATADRRLAAPVSRDTAPSDQSTLPTAVHSSPSSLPAVSGAVPPSPGGPADPSGEAPVNVIASAAAAEAAKAEQQHRAALDAQLVASYSSLTDKDRRALVRALDTDVAALCALYAHLKVSAASLLQPRPGSTATSSLAIDIGDTTSSTGIGSSSHGGGVGGNGLHLRRQFMKALSDSQREALLQHLVAHGEAPSTEPPTPLFDADPSNALSAYSPDAPRGASSFGPPPATATTGPVGSGARRSSRARKGSVASHAQTTVPRGAGTGTSAGGGPERRMVHRRRSSARRRLSTASRTSSATGDSTTAKGTQHAGSKHAHGKGHGRRGSNVSHTSHVSHSSNAALVGTGDDADADAIRVAATVADVAAAAPFTEGLPPSDGVAAAPSLELAAEAAAHHFSSAAAAGDDLTMSMPASGGSASPLSGATRADKGSHASLDRRSISGRTRLGARATGAATGAQPLRQSSLRRLVPLQGPVASDAVATHGAPPSPPQEPGTVGSGVNMVVSPSRPSPQQAAARLVTPIARGPSQRERHADMASAALTSVEFDRANDPAHQHQRQSHHTVGSAGSVMAPTLDRVQATGNRAATSAGAGAGALDSPLSSPALGSQAVVATTPVSPGEASVGGSMAGSGRWQLQRTGTGTGSQRSIGSAASGASGSAGVGAGEVGQSLQAAGLAAGARNVRTLGLARSGSERELKRAQVARLERMASHTRSGRAGGVKAVLGADAKSFPFEPVTPTYPPPSANAGATEAAAAGGGPRASAGGADMSIAAMAAASRDGVALERSHAGADAGSRSGDGGGGTGGGSGSGANVSAEDTAPAVGLGGDDDDDEAASPWAADTPKAAGRKHRATTLSDATTGGGRPRTESTVSRDSPRAGRDGPQLPVSVPSVSVRSTALVTCMDAEAAAAATVDQRMARRLSRTGSGLRLTAQQEAELAANATSVVATLLSEPPMQPTDGASGGDASERNESDS